MLEGYRRLLMASFLLTPMATAQEFQTLTYFKNDSISLDLDLFIPENEPSLNTPLLIYVHGGGFANGTRTRGHNLATFLIGQNIACASISYTLYMKDKSFGCDGILTEKIKAIQIAVSQLWHATAYLIEQSDQIHINPSQIFLAGSSAGAETVLHAVYWNRKQMQLYEPKLVPEFRYAGVIVGAGAIMDLNLITQENKIPLMAFHGDADPTVPFRFTRYDYFNIIAITPMRGSGGDS